MVVGLSVSRQTSHISTQQNHVPKRGSLIVQQAQGKIIIFSKFWKIRLKKKKANFQRNRVYLYFFAITVTKLPFFFDSDDFLSPFQKIKGGGLTMPHFLVLMLIIL